MHLNHLPYIEISLDNLIHNLNLIREKIPSSSSVMAVVKDNAYGCGAIVISQILEQEGVDFFAVANVGEAKELRENDIHSPILAFGECTDDEMSWASKNNTHITINSIASLKKIAMKKQSIKLHINLDTGMNRLGLSESELNSALEIISSKNNLELEGMFTHFASADKPHTETVSKQYNHFTDALKIVEKKGLSPRYIHAPNSAALIRFPIPDNHLVRPGIILYGCKPDPAQNFNMNIRPVASMKSSIIKIKKVPSGTPISYGGNYVTKKETYIATIALGYAHGLPRLLSGKGEVLIRGKRFPIVGNITMDSIMADIGNNNDIKVGDEVVSMGNQGSETITPDDIACLCGTIGYEILCGMSNRIDRYFIKDNMIIKRYIANL